ncbi:MAG TPA: hypothetical protein VNQ77_04235 [Frankiaceae bacterium]|nr:hypothetical protein [Frankiaceae bacterium]
MTDGLEHFEFGDESNTCVRCGIHLTTHGVQEFRTGGSVGIRKFILGDWGEIGEGMLPLLVMSCRQCKRVELRIPAF